jgi:integrase
MPRRKADATRRKLTDLAVGKLKPREGRRLTIWDSTLPGFGVRVSPKGRKTWIAMYRVNRRQVLETIGNTKWLPKVADARKRARASMDKAQQGVNPVEERRAQAATAGEAGKSTFEAIFRLYVRRQLQPKTKARHASEVERSFGKDVLPRLGKRPISSITRAEARRLIEEVHDRGAPAAANRLLALLRAFSLWAVREEYLANDFTKGLDRVSPKVARERVLTDDEVVAFWHACDAIGSPYAQCFRLLLLTGQRRDEVGHMEWAELDLGKKVWNLPAARAKNSRAHEIQLSDLALEIIGSVYRTSDRFVLSSDGFKPLSGWSAAKSRLDRHMPGIAPWRLHDLRRTAASGMASLAIAPHVVDRVLNHTSGTISGVAAIYNRHEYRDERRAALQTWSNYVANLIDPAAAANVVPINMNTSRPIESIAGASNAR